MQYAMITLQTVVTTHTILYRNSMENALPRMAYYSERCPCI